MWLRISDRIYRILQAKLFYDMNAYLGIGSNVEEASAFISKALRLLDENGYKLTGCSDTYVVSTPYLNLVAQVECATDYPELLRFTKDIEKRLGRKPEHKASGIVPIDIDIVVCDDDILRPKDFGSKYFSEGYNQIINSTSEIRESHICEDLH